MLGYAFIDRKIVEINSDDYPGYVIYKTHYGIILYYADDEISVYTSKEELIKTLIEEYENKNIENHKLRESINWNTISNNLIIDDLKKELN